MKLFDISKKYAIESVDLTSDDSLGIEVVDDGKNLINFEHSSEEINAAVETINMAYRDIETMDKARSIKTQISDPVALEAIALTESIIYKRYGYTVATESDDKGFFSKIFSFIADAFKWLCDKIKSFLGFGEKSVQGNQAATDANLEAIKEQANDREMREKAEELIRKGHEDDEFKLYHQKGLVIINNIDRLIPNDPSPTGLKKAIEGSGRLAADLSKSLVRLNALAEPCLRSVDDCLSGKITSDEFTKIRIDFYERFFSSVSGYTKKDTNELGEKAIYEIKSPISINSDIKLNDFLGVSTFVKATSGVTDEAQKKDKPYIEIDLQALEKLSQLASKQKVFTISKGAEKVYNKLSERFKDLADKKGLLDGDDDDLKIKRVNTSNFAKDVKEIAFAIWKALSALCTFEGRLSKEFLNATERVKKHIEKAKNKSASTESYLLTQDRTYHESLNFYEDNSLESYSIVANNLFTDYHNWIACESEGRRYIITEDGEFSMEGYYNHLQDKYSFVNFSLEEEETKKEDPKPDADKPKEEAKAEGEESKDKKEETAGDRFFEKVKNFFKEIVKFFVKVFKAIKDKIVGLFSKDDKKEKNAEKRAETNKEKVEEIAKALKEKEKSKKIVESPDEYPEDVVNYHKDSKYALSLNSTVFSLGKEPTVKDIIEANKDLRSAMNFIPTLVSNLIGSSEKFKETLKMTLTGSETDFDKLRLARAEFLRNMRDIVNTAYNGSSFRKEGEFILFVVSKNYMYCPQTPLMEIGETGKFVVDRGVAPDFAQEAILMMKSGDVLELSDINDTATKYRADFNKSMEARVAELDKSAGEFSRLIADYGDNQHHNEQTMQFAKMCTNYITSLSSAIGRIGTFIHNYAEYLHILLTNLVIHEDHLSKGKKAPQTSMEKDLKDKDKKADNESKPEETSKPSEDKKSDEPADKPAEDKPQKSTSARDEEREKSSERMQRMKEFIKDIDKGKEVQMPPKRRRRNTNKPK